MKQKFRALVRLKQYKKEREKLLEEVDWKTIRKNLLKKRRKLGIV